METQQQQLRDRTKLFAYRVIRLFQALPSSTVAQVVGKQLLRSGTSVAANYRACNRSRSKADFIAKLSIVVEEADESVFWLECLADNGIVDPQRISSLLTEANELVRIFSASRHTAKSQP